MKRKKFLAVLLSLSFVMNGLVPLVTYAEEQEFDAVEEEMSAESTDADKQVQPVSEEDEKLEVEPEDMIEAEEPVPNISDVTAVIGASCIIQI